VYVKNVLLALALAMVVLAGAGVAYASGSGEDSSEPQATDPASRRLRASPSTIPTGVRLQALRSATKRDTTRSRSSARTAARSMST
jgi:hypothetical protein